MLIGYDGIAPVPSATGHHSQGNPKLLRVLIQKTYKEQQAQHLA
jgi:hypothetical protein